MISSCSAWMVATMSSISPVRARSSSASNASPPRRRVSRHRRGPAEEVVGHRDHRVADRPSPGADVADPRASSPGPIEGHGHRRPPVDDDRVAQASSTWRRPICQDGPPSRRSARRGAVAHSRRGRPPGGPAPPGSRDRAARRREIPEQALCPLRIADRESCTCRRCACSSLELGIGERGGQAHRNRLHVEAPFGKQVGAKVPGHSGDRACHLHSLQYKPSTC